MKARKLAVFTLVALLIFTACQKEKPIVPESEPQSSSVPEEESDPNWPAKVRTIVLDEKPEVIISLSPALTELTYELDQTLSGISQFCDYPEEVSSLTSYGTADQPDLDALEKAKPDLILSSAPLTGSVIETLEEAGTVVLVLPRTDSMEGLKDTYIDLATAFYGLVDGPEQGEKVYEPLRERYDELVSDSIGENSGIWLRAKPLLMATGDTWEGKLLQEVFGIKNDAAEYVGWQYPQEKAADLYPDVIFYDASIPTEYFGTTQIYSTTDAYKQKKMYPFNSLPFERQTGRMIDELERMAQALVDGSVKPNAS